MRKKKRQGTEEAGSVGAPSSPRLTPADVQQKEFRLAFRGYNERDVDAFLDHVTEEIGAYFDENRSLREQLTASPAEPLLGSTDPGSSAPSGAEAEAAAEQVLAAAREEAARIVSEARDEADGLLAAAAAGRGDRAEASMIMAPFLSRERDFLQQLGRLVQDHAESIRGMVQSARDGQTRMAEPEPEPSEELAAEEAITLPEAETPDRAEGSEAQPPTGVHTKGEPAQEEDPERSRSLRELFWGED